MAAPHIPLKRIADQGRYVPLGRGLERSRLGCRLVLIASEDPCARVRHIASLDWPLRASLQSWEHANVSCV